VAVVAAQDARRSKGEITVKVLPSLYELDEMAKAKRAANEEQEDQDSAVAHNSRINFLQAYTDARGFRSALLG